MRTTLKRIDVGSAFRVGIVLYGLLFAVFGLLFVGLQSLFLNAITRSTSFNVPNGAAVVFGTGILSLLCFYGVGIVFAAIGGGITFALTAFFYNLTANWVGGIKLELETGDSGLLDDIARDELSRG